MSTVRSFRARGWIAVLFASAVLLTGMAAAVSALASSARLAKAVPTACPDTIACHALKRAATP
jgi:hypothetical protein